VEHEKKYIKSRQQDLLLEVFWAKNWAFPWLPGGALHTLVRCVKLPSSPNSTTAIGSLCTQAQGMSVGWCLNVLKKEFFSHPSEMPASHQEAFWGIAMCPDGDIRLIYNLVTTTRFKLWSFSFIWTLAVALVWGAMVFEYYLDNIHILNYISQIL
jgi:hypothetical protein